MLATLTNAQSPGLPPGFAGAAVAEGLNPTCMALAPDGRIFLAQKDGRVLIYHTDAGELHDAPFVSLQTDPFNERGLNGIALHPDFEHQPWVYLYYTAPDAPRNRISRIRANGDFAVPGSEEILLELDPMNGNIHNGGGMVFGPDDKLYIGVGDGARADNAQDLNTVLGKILRLNADGSIPVDNPFYTQATGNNRAIFAYGVRNPFSMSMDPQTEKIFFCDVGAEAWEEVNVLKSGANYGWKLFQGASGEPGFMDPAFAYTHASGCAVVGAAFPFQAYPLIPPAYAGKLFFADYCAGWIKMLDPASGSAGDVFATGIDRPVSLLSGPDGDLYYLARAGLGGGSPLDNTASTEGVLWRVFWVGAGAPLITGQPKPVLIAEGESAWFRAEAYGDQPLGYQWYRDGDAVSDADSSLLVLDNLELADSGALVFCIVSNAWGADTSVAALLGVSANRRPEPEILLPTAGSFYRGGDTLRFSGQALDPEDGLLGSDRLSWRIDFHHADHSHPAMPTTTGFDEGAYATPTVGETAADVFYRIYLTAEDQAGFSQTVFRDVWPEIKPITITGPAGIQVNVDGQLRTLPATVESVIGLRRIIEAPATYQLGDTIFMFRSWSDGVVDPLLSFVMPDSARSFELIYDFIVLGSGTGLLGHYFFDPEGDFDEIPAFARIDSTINFMWNDAAPDPALPSDYFTVRWMGFVQPLYSEMYTFSVRSDDGCRLWINDQLVIDQWVPQATTEHSGQIQLTGGKKYRIRLEYLEIGGGANVALFWQSQHQLLEIVPKRQLYPPAFTLPATLSGTIGLDINNDGVWAAGEPGFSNAQVRLFDADTDSLLAETRTLANGRYTFLDLPAGIFYLRITLPATGDVLLPVQHVDSSGLSVPIDLAEGAFETFDVAWAVPAVALAGTVWLDENRDAQMDPTEPFLQDITVLIYRADSTLVAAGMTDESGGYGFPLLAPGTYFLVFLHQLAPRPLIPGHGLNANGQTAGIAIGQGQFQVIDVAFEPDTGISGLPIRRADAFAPGLRIFPNPARTQLTVRVSNVDLAPVIARIRIFDLHGRLELETAASGPGQVLDVSALPAGRYVLIWESGTVQVGRPFLKL
ncbi:MAG: PQQ-dependent sugar dehydrogenase [Lewinellaceae bacterium]|nr:PQQ-dependent sugar dehydrogenase [Lewinellaceae bacterium]